MFLQQRPWWQWAALLAIVVCFAGLAANALSEIARRWSTEAEYGHGWLVPFICAYMVWGRKACLEVQPASVWALGLLAGAAVMAFIGAISGLFFLLHIALVVAIIAVVGLLFGRAGMVQLAAPLAFLSFAVPLPYVIEVALTSKLQLLSSHIGVAFIERMGIVVYLAGNVIDLGAVKLQVVEACSGLRYLYPLMSLGFLAAYFYSGPGWIRGLLLVSTVPITVLLNSVRIALMAWLVEHFGLEVAQGFFHDFEGWVIFAGCMLILAAELWLCNAVFVRRSIWLMLNDGTRATQTVASIAPVVLAKKATIVWGLAVAIAASALVAVLWINNRQLQTPPATFLAAFPLQFEPWYGQPVAMDTSTLQALGVDDYLLVNFLNKGNKTGAPVNFYVAYYGHQQSGQSPHSPKVCIPGGGWQIDNIRRMQVAHLEVNRVLISSKTQRQLVYYWFVERGVPRVDEYQRKWFLLKDFFLYGRSDGTLVRVTTPIATTEDDADADTRLQQFVRTVVPALGAYLPAAPQETPAQ